MIRLRCDYLPGTYIEGEMPEILGIFAGMLEVVRDRVIEGLIGRPERDLAAHLGQEAGVNAAVTPEAKRPRKRKAGPKPKPVVRVPLRPFRCKTCDEPFKTEVMLHKHERKAHPNALTFKPEEAPAPPRKAGGRPPVRLTLEQMCDGMQAYVDGKSIEAFCEEAGVRNRPLMSVIVTSMVELCGGERLKGYHPHPDVRAVKTWLGLTREERLGIAQKALLGKRAPTSTGGSTKAVPAVA